MPATLQDAIKANKNAIEKYEKILASQTDYTDSLNAAKAEVVSTAKAVRDMQMQSLTPLSDLMGSVPVRGRKHGSGGKATPGVTAISGEGETGKKRGRPKKVV